MELNIEQVAKALKCWTSPAMLENTSCVGCYFETKGLCEQNCTMDLADAALAIIKELSEENEYLKQQNEIYEVLNKKLADACESYAWTYGTAVSKELFLKKERTDAVKEMQEKITSRYAVSKVHYIGHAEPTITYEFTNWDLDQMVKEILEEKNDG